MKKFIVLSLVFMSLASCSKGDTQNTSDTASTTSTNAVVGTGTTGTGGDKEVEQTMKEIDGIFNDLSGSGTGK